MSTSFSRIPEISGHQRAALLTSACCWALGGLEKRGAEPEVEQEADS